mmetsp:Transcript_127900/g.343229  ORF Transcript_127900/g.343229 Transcript_127900/m.343229 type:complete len:306 (-) Transcript_127900:146-1063(-)
MTALAHVPQLRAPGSTAIDADGEDADTPAELFGLCLDLTRQLARRGHDQHLRPVVIWAAAQKGRERRKQEGQRLAAASLGDADQVAARLRNGPAVGLDWGWRCEAESVDTGHDLLGETAAVKGRVRLRDLALAPHLRLCEVGLGAPDLLPCQGWHRIAPRARGRLEIAHDVADVAVVGTACSTADAALTLPSVGRDVGALPRVWRRVGALVPIVAHPGALAVVLWALLHLLGAIAALRLLGEAGAALLEAAVLEAALLEAALRRHLHLHLAASTLRHGLEAAVGRLVSSHAALLHVRGGGAALAG